MPDSKPKLIKQKDLADLAWKRQRLSSLSKKDTENILQVFIDEIIEQLQSNNSVRLTGLGTFTVNKRHSRKAVSPQNPQETIIVPETNVLKFKSGHRVKRVLKK